MVVVFCENCGKKQERDKWKAERFRYCSRKCRAITKQKKFIKNCERCKKDFLCHLYRKDSVRFCSQECRKLLLKSICKICEKEFVSKPIRGKPKLFCSLVCKKKYHEFNKIKLECYFCGLSFIREKYNIKKNKCFCSKKCFDKSKSGINRENFVSKRKNNKGYWILNLPEGGHVLEHIKIMQDFIGRKLKKNEIVHHINEIKTDNRLENLKLMTRSEHAKYHRNKQEKLREKSQKVCIRLK